MPRLTKQQVQTAREIVRVPVPELGGTKKDKAAIASGKLDEAESYVLVRTLTAGEFDAWEAARLEKHGKNRRVNYRYFRASLVALCWVDEEGKPEFTAEEIDDMPAKPIDRIFQAAKAANGASDEDADFFSESSATTGA